MGNISVIFVDNIENLLNSQIETLSSIISNIIKKWKVSFPTLEIKHTDDADLCIKVDPELSIRFYSELLEVDPTAYIDFRELADTFFNKYPASEENKTLFVVDLCLDPRNIDTSTGIALIDKILTAEKDYVNVIACSAVPEFDDLGFVGAYVAHRSVTSDDIFQNMIPATSSNDSIPKRLSEIPDCTIKKLINLLLENSYKNTRYFGEVLFYALLLYNSIDF